MSEKIISVIEPAEAKRRDALILQALKELRSFPANLPIKSYERRLDINSFEDVFVFPSPLFNEEWALREIERIAKDVKKIVVNQILQQLDELLLRDFILRGSASDVANKLTCRFFYDDSCWKEDSFDCENEFNIEYCQPILEITFHDIFDVVVSTYEKKFMKYRLWDKPSIYALYNFMMDLLNGKNFNLADYYPELNDDYLDDNGRYPLLSKSEFIEMLNEAIEYIPWRESTELPLPFWNRNGDLNYENGLVVGEYVPLSMAPDKLIDVIYSDYLKEIESQVKKYVVEISAHFNLELDYQFSDEELRDAESVIAELFENLETEIQSDFHSNIGGDILIEFRSARRRRNDNTYKLTGSFSQCFEFEEKDIDGDELVGGVFDSQLESMKAMLENAIEQGRYDLIINSFSWDKDEVIEELVD